MQEFSSNRYSDIIETNVALIRDVGSVARRLSFYIGNGLSNLLGRIDRVRVFGHVEALSESGCPALHQRAQHLESLPRCGEDESGHRRGQGRRSQAPGAGRL